MKVSLIVTVLNEEKTISDFLNSVFFQSKFPDEIIIVDGGSADKTISEISNFKFPISKANARIKVIFKKGNRSVGRNKAIKRSGNEIIVCSDAGCILDKNWLENIIKPFKDVKIDAVAGYYKGIGKTVFQKCLIPYVLVMPDKIKANEFLPATRSMAFRKSIWEKVGGFDEKYSHNEDYVFANKLKNKGAHIVFEEKAIVGWIPRKTFKSAFKMFFRFALGDSESGILRGKVFLIFARYALFFYILLLSFIEKSLLPLYMITVSLLLYIAWSINKNYKYVQDKKAFIFLPLLQFTSDIAVMAGTIIGFLKRIRLKNICKAAGKNKGIVLIIGLYALCMFLLINWGIPNQNHPFDYFMDEWHQAQAVRAVFTQGSPNIPGAANGSIFHFLLSGLMLTPFIAMGIVNPLVIQSSMDSFEMQQRLFQILRLNTLFFGIASIILITYIAKKYFKLNPLFATFLFVVNPIWLMLSNYFKYDIALIFWIILSFLLMLRYSIEPSFKKYILAAFVCGIAFSVKLSAISLLPVLVISYFVYAKKRINNIKHLITGISIFFFTFLLFGIPDLLLGKGNISEYLYDNLVRTPNYSSNYILDTNYIFYLFFRGTSTIFGYFLFYLSNIAVLFAIGYLLKNKLKEEINKRYLLALIFLFFFIFSLLFLKIEARGNRLLVLLPFITLFCGIFIDRLLKLVAKLKKIIIFILIIFCFFQLMESFGWINLKLKSDLRQSSSMWIATNIPVGSIIGIENIPIYQFLPDILLKDYYLSDRQIAKSKYVYKVIDSVKKELFQLVIVTNREVAEDYLVDSPKKDLLLALEERNYGIIYHQELNLKELILFRTKLDYFMSGLVQEPLSITIFEKQNAMLSKNN